MGIYKGEKQTRKAVLFELERFRISCITLILNNLHNSLSLKRVIYLFLVFS